MAEASCLVTGVAGFIGSHLAERLVREGHLVVGVDCFTDYYPRWLKERNLALLRGHERFALLEADLLDLNLIALLRGDVLAAERTQIASGSAQSNGARVERIFHLAAQPGVRASWGTSFEIYARNNILATQRLLEAAREVPPKKFVYASSSSVYGDAEAFPTHEDVAPRPVSPYGVTKLAGEHLCLLYARNYGIPTVGLRYFTVYGPRQRPDMAFRRFIEAILKGREILVYGDGEQTRDFTYVDDAVEGTMRAGFCDAAGEVFNIGGGSRVTLNTVLALMEVAAKGQAVRRYTSPQKGDVKDTGADIRKACDKLGYRPAVSLTEGLAREVNWLRGHEEEPDDSGVRARSVTGAA